MSGRAFTVAEANALIPELEGVLARVREQLADMQRHQDQLKILDALWGPALERPETPDHEEFLAHRAALRGLTSDLERMINEEIVDRGVRFPPGGLEHGLLDFPTVLDGRWVFLCWRSGEPRVQAWHEIEGGFAGRRPLTEAEAARMGRAV